MEVTYQTLDKFGHRLTVEVRSSYASCWKGQISDEYGYFPYGRIRSDTYDVFVFPHRSSEQVQMHGCSIIDFKMARESANEETIQGESNE